MSYINKSTNPFVSIKLTEKGRENLAKGQLNFAFWAIGDSEINYERESIVDANQDNAQLSGSSRVFRPFDRQPNIKYFITSPNSSNLNQITSSNINVVKAVINNKATDRGFFSSNTINTTYTSSTYVKGFTEQSNKKITGGTTMEITSAITVNVGDFVRIKVNNDKTSPVNDTPTSNRYALPNLWYKIQSTAATATGTSITVDRKLPNMASQTATTSYMFFYKNGEVADTFGYDTSTAYWDSGTLSFDSATNITCNDVKVWNMNNVWCENLAGITGLSTTKLYEDYTKFGSYDYLGTKNPYLEYLCQSNLADVAFNCNGLGYSYLDNIHKSLCIIHYTNNTISNLYGEFFYIDVLNNKTLTLTIPTLMYHRRDYSTATGQIMGMRFISSGATKTIGTSNIEYVDLYEDPTMVSNQQPKVVGKVFTQLKIVVIDDDEIVVALSYKSNRNWTLPALSANLTAPTGGTGTGVLEVNKTMYLTYALDNNSGTGLTPTLPCQTYVKITNNTSDSKDVSFRLEDTDLLPYMRKKEETLIYDGYGFYATNFKLLYQVVDQINDRPDPGSWKVYDYTTTGLTTNVGETIDPRQLENQTPTSAGFILTKAISGNSSIYDITVPLSMATNSSPNTLQFGDERFFYGNLSTYIGATVYKTLFDVRLNASQYNSTTNPTRSSSNATNPPNIKITEIGIYDSNQELVIIGKTSQPIALTQANTIMLELSLDF